MGQLMRRRGYVPHRDEEDPGILRYIKQLQEPDTVESAAPA
jgi:hypothetical protein